MIKTIKEQRNRASVKVLMADSDTYIRQAFSNALSSEGYRDIRTLSRLSLLRDVLTATVPDLVILDSEMPDGDAIELVREVRNGQLGRNPFVPIILTVWDSDGLSIDEAVNSGVDLILELGHFLIQLLHLPIVQRLGQLLADRQTGSAGQRRAWTDDFANLLSVQRWH